MLEGTSVPMNNPAIPNGSAATTHIANHPQQKQKNLKANKAGHQSFIEHLPGTTMAYPMQYPLYADAKYRHLAARLLHVVQYMEDLPTLCQELGKLTPWNTIYGNALGMASPAIEDRIFFSRSELKLLHA